MTVVTISHQIASGGREIGQALASQLGIFYLDRQIISKVAQKLGISETTATEMDEKSESLIWRIVTSITSSYQPMVDGMAAFAGVKVPSDDSVTNLQYFQVFQKVIEAAANTNQVIIAGHGANFALAGSNNVLNLYIYAPTSQRVATLMQRNHITSSQEALLQIKRNDQERAHYIKTFYQADWRDPLYYHIMLNTSVINNGLAVELIEKALSNFGTA